MTGAEVEVVGGAEVVARAGNQRDTFSVLEAAVALANVICDTEMVPAVLQGRPGRRGGRRARRLRTGPRPDAIASNHRPDRRPPCDFRPKACALLVLAAGHSLIVEATDDVATVQSRRREWPAEQWTRHTFTLADAERAKLLGKNWITSPRAMLTARATGEACRATFPDVIAGLSYTADELDDMPRPPAPAPPRPRPSGGLDQKEVDQLEGRLSVAPEPIRHAFRDWRGSQGYAWPPHYYAMYAEMVDKLDELVTAYRPRTGRARRRRYPGGMAEGRRPGRPTRSPGPRILRCPFARCPRFGSTRALRGRICLSCSPWPTIPTPSASAGRALTGSPTWRAPAARPCFGRSTI